MLKIVGSTSKPSTVVPPPFCTRQQGNFPTVPPQVPLWIERWDPIGLYRIDMSRSAHFLDRVSAADEHLGDFEDPASTTIRDPTTQKILGAGPSDRFAVLGGIEDDHVAGSE